MDCTIIECIFMKSNEIFIKHKYLKFQLNIKLNSIKSYLLNISLNMILHIINPIQNKYL